MVRINYSVIINDDDRNDLWIHQNGTNIINTACMACDWYQSEIDIIIQMTRTHDSSAYTKFKICTLNLHRSQYFYKAIYIQYELFFIYRQKSIIFSTNLDTAHIWSRLTHVCIVCTTNWQTIFFITHSRNIVRIFFPQYYRKMYKNFC